MDIDIFKRNNISVEGNSTSSHTIIFAHGFGTDQTAWSPVKKAFSNDYRLVLYDNIGAGKADIKAYSPIKYQFLQGYAEDLIQIATSLHLRNAIFIGHSVSSMVGLLASVKRPDLFSKLILIGGSPRYLNDREYVGGFNQEDLDQLYSGMTANYFEWVGGFSKLMMGNENNPALSEEFAKSLLSLRADIALAVAKSIFQSDFRSLLERVNKDVLILQAANDVAVPAEVGHYMQAKIKGSKLSTIQAEGHFPHMSAPDQVIREIKKFISL